MPKIIGLNIPRKQRDPYVAPDPKDMPIFPMGPGGSGGPGGPGMPGMPGGPMDNGMAPPPPSASDEKAKACVVVDHGALDLSGCEEGMIGSTPITPTGADGLQIVTADCHTGGICCTGEGTDFLLENAVISIAGNGPDNSLGGRSCAVVATDHAKVTLRNCDISSSGVSRSTTICENHGEMRIYDSTLVTHGAPWGTSAREHRPSAAYREFQGNARNHCTMSNGQTHFYNCRIHTDGWAAVSTDAAQGYVYVEANDCDIKTRSGYAAYADGGCHDVFNRCTISSGSMAAVLAGESSVTYNGCKVDCGSYFTKFHCVMGKTFELGTAVINGCSVRCKDTALIVRSANAEIRISSSDIRAENGILLKAEQNFDPMYTKTDGRIVYGVHASITDCELEGDIISADPDRDVYVYLSHTELKGAVKDAYLTMDDKSRWYASADSTVTLIGEADAMQFDAPAGVTITAACGMNGTFPLPSGGTLVLKTLE